MSYPRQITVVAIEDELPMRQRYEYIFDVYARQYRTAPLLMLGSLGEAQDLLAGDTIIHLLVLDLNLPGSPRGTADPGVTPGLMILSAAAKRDHLPIPAVLVISGRMDQASQTDLQGHLDQFWHAQELNKSVDDEEKAISEALDKVDQYTGIGIHIRDTGRPSPILAAREDDLLRRCALGNGAIGLDLQWWGAYEARSTMTGEGEARVLAGAFLLDQGMGKSRPTFFKFEPWQNAASVFRDAGVMNQKLSHVKVVYSKASQSRALLATQTVSASGGKLCSLQDFLEQPAKEVIPMLAGVVTDVRDQLSQLGPTSETQRLVCKVLWPHHDRKRLVSVWETFEGAAVAPGFDVAALFDELHEDPSAVWLEERACNHGDLNPTNVAIEVSGSNAKAYIFDAGGVQRDAALRDLAYLEVTSLLHHRSRALRESVEQCGCLYGDQRRLSGVDEVDEFGCIRRLIECIREGVQARDRTVYALLVLDAALLQLGGLAVGGDNKIANPAEAIRLVRHAAQWYRGLRNAEFGRSVT